TFTDKGGRSMTLRPEWTAPVMRAGLQHGLFDQGPQRLYYLGPIFRYERPQAGRYRQSHQFGIECTGFEGAEADVEVIELGWNLMQAFGLSQIRLLLNSIGDETCRPRYRDALIAYFTPHRDELSEDSQRRLERNPLRILDSKAPADRPFVESAPKIVDYLCNACRDHFDRVRQYLDAIGVPYVLDPFIVRGLDYYTRTVFEFATPASGAQSTICAGGRYDDLIASLGGKRTPAVGFALGLERFLAAAQGPPTEGVRTGVQAIALGAAPRERLVVLTAQLRRSIEAPVFMDYGDRKLLAQLRLADKNGARWALILGSDELAAAEVVVRDLQERNDRRLPLADTVRMLVEWCG
ncbi:MAG: histidine--tRNA ligase, partial [Candidatus Eremiobacteraeota bacterium]|nr:histidine--tRNA ligase [Candidatus Eremiobacteraeota bacterium]